MTRSTCIARASRLRQLARKLTVPAQAMPPTQIHLSNRRSTLAKIARREGEKWLQGDANQAGPAIEPYLSVFREALNLNCESDHYSDLDVGYSWCCAFAYYCCLQAGFRFPPKPVAG